MKMIVIACNLSILERIIDLINSLKIDSWQVIENVQGKLPSSNPRMNSPVWPGYNALVLIQTDVRAAEKIKAACTLLNEQSHNQQELLHAWIFEANSLL